MKQALARATVVAATLLFAACAGIALAQQSDDRARVVASNRDPLAPPRDLYVAQNLPGLRVTVIGYNRERPDRSMAVVRLGTQPPVRRVVYTGDRIGDYRIVRIEATRVVAAAPAFGGSTRIDLTVGDTTSSSR